MNHPLAIAAASGTFDDIVKLAQALAWPLIVLLALALLRPYLPGAARSIAARVTRVSVANISVDLVASEVRSDLWDSLGYLRDPSASQRWSDSGRMLFTLIKSGQRADSAVIDLGSGNRWLTSRLFIFATLLPDLLGVRCLVFLETRAGIPRSFVGLANPTAVRQAIARRQPWLEQIRLINQFNFQLPQATAARATLLEAIKRQPKEGNWWELERPLRELAAAGLEAESQFNPEAAEMFANSYLNDPLLYRQVTADSPEEPGWVRLGPLPENGTLLREEHTHWISDGVALEALIRESLISAPLPDVPGTRLRDLQRQLVLAENADFVALVDDNQRFRRLFDRQRIVEHLARETAERAA